MISSQTTKHIRYQSRQTKPAQGISKSPVFGDLHVRDNIVFVILPSDTQYSKQTFSSEPFSLSLLLSFKYRFVSESEKRWVTWYRALSNHGRPFSQPGIPSTAFVSWDILSLGFMLPSSLNLLGLSDTKGLCATLLKVGITIVDNDFCNFWLQVSYVRNSGSLFETEIVGYHGFIFSLSLFPSFPFLSILASCWLLSIWDVMKVLISAWTCYKPGVCRPHGR